MANPTSTATKPIDLLVKALARALVAEEDPALRAWLEALLAGDGPPDDNPDD